jgi:hypothetical protein
MGWLVSAASNATQSITIDQFERVHEAFFSLEEAKR